MRRPTELQEPIAYGKWLLEHRTAEEWREDDHYAALLRRDWDNASTFFTSGNDDIIGRVPYEDRESNSSPDEDVVWLFGQREELRCIQAAQAEEIARLREALAEYADPDNWTGGIEYVYGSGWRDSGFLTQYVGNSGESGCDIAARALAVSPTFGQPAKE